MVMSILAATFMVMYLVLVSLPLLYVNAFYYCQDDESYYDDNDAEAGNSTEICVDCVPRKEACHHSAKVCCSKIFQ